jgi:hypothetical protein
VAQQHKQDWCNRCGRLTLHVAAAEPYQVPHVFHLLMTVLCLGTWLLVWFFHVVANMLLPGRLYYLCTICGQEEGVQTPKQQATEAARDSELDRGIAEIRAEAYGDRLKRRAYRRKMRETRRRRFWQGVDGWLLDQLGEGPAVGFFGGVFRGMAYLIPIAAIVLGLIALVYYLVNRGLLPSP